MKYTFAGEQTEIRQVRIEIVEEDYTWSFPIHCPRWLLWVLSKLEI